MARYNELQVGRYNRMAQKLMSIKGPAALESLMPELGLTLSIFSGAENRYLESWDRFGLAASIGAQGVGNNSILQIVNPVGSNVVAIVEAADAMQPGAANIDVQMTLNSAAQSALGIAETPKPLDTRGRTSSTTVWSGGNAVAITAIRELIGTNMQFIQYEDQQIALLPGSTFRLQTVSTNVAAIFSVILRERFLEESERT